MQRLKRPHDRRERPGRHEFLDARFETLNPLLRDPGRLDHLVQGDLMGGMIEPLLPQPTQMARSKPSFAEKYGRA
jgi:hypothetical protein